MSIGFEKQSGIGDEGAKPDFWLTALLITVLFSPTIRLPGGVPLRLDDLVTFGGGFVLLLRYVCRLRLPKLDRTIAALAFTAGSVLAVTILSGSTSTVTIGVKEYLDVLRPLKFLVAYLVVRGMDKKRSLFTFVRVMAVSAHVLAGCAIIQLFFLNPGSSNVVASFFLLFSELHEEHIRSFFGARAFATFHTPTDLGFVAVLILLAALVLPRFSNRSRTVVAASGALVMSGTRTFLFGMPFLLIGYSILAAGDSRTRLKRLLLSLVLIAVVALVSVTILPLVVPGFATNITRSFDALLTGNFEDDQSISDRLENLRLMQYTWQNAKYFGVVTRSMLGPAADSEYLLTFHRYGLFGLFQLAILYLAMITEARKSHPQDASISTYVVLVAGTTMLYGITQGALINTRIGTLVFVILGLMTAKTNAGSDQCQPALPSEATS